MDKPSTSRDTFEDEDYPNLPKRKRLETYQFDELEDDYDFRYNSDENGDSTWQPTDSDVEENASYYELLDDYELESFIEIRANHTNGELHLVHNLNFLSIFANSY